MRSSSKNILFLSVTRSVKLVLISQILLSSIAVANEAKKTNPFCGAYCLYIAEKALGKGPESFDSITKTLGNPTVKGYSIEQLKEHAVNCGLASQVIQVSDKELPDFVRPFGCIALLNSDHFVIITEASDKEVEIIDPPNAYKLPKDVFNQEWTGYLLIICKDSITPRARFYRVYYFLGFVLLIIVLTISGRLGWKYMKGNWQIGVLLIWITSLTVGCNNGNLDPVNTQPRVSDLKTGPIDIKTVSPIRSQPTIEDLGFIVFDSNNQQRTIETKIVNETNTPVVIRTIRPGCSCSIVRLDSMKIPPHSFSKLYTTIHFNSSDKARRNEVLLDTDNAEIPTIKCIYKWNIINQLEAIPEEMSLSRTGKNGISTQIIQILSNDFVLCKKCIVKIHKDTNIFDVRFDENTALTRSSDSSHSTTDKNIFDKASNRQILGYIAASLHATELPNDSIFDLDCIIECDGRLRTNLRIPVRISVLPEISLSPSRIFLGTIKRSKVPFKITVLRRDNVPFTVKSVRSLDKSIEVTISSIKGKQVCQVVELAFEYKGSSEVLRSAIEIELDTGQIFSVPISGIFQEK